MHEFDKDEVQDKYENGRGTTLSDVFYRGQLDIVSSNWNGNHRIFALDGNEFRDIGMCTYLLCLVGCIWGSDTWGIMILL